MAEPAAGLTSRSLGAVQTAPGQGDITSLKYRLRALLEDQREALPLWLPVALGAGIAAWFLLPWASQRMALAVALAGLGLAALLLRRRWAGALLLVMLAGLAITQWRVASTAHVVLTARTVAAFTARVEAMEPRAARDQLRLTLAVESWEVPDPRLPQRLRVSLRGAAADRALASGLAPGARIAARAALSPPPGPIVPGGHDMARSLWFEEIGATGTLLGGPRLIAPAPPSSGPLAWLASARQRLTAHIRSALPGETGAVAAVFVTGDRGAVPLDTAQAIRDSGLAHLLSISGLHIAVVVGGVVVLTRRLLALSPWLALRLPLRLIALVAGAMAGLGYTLLAGAEVPTVRAMLATLIIIAGLIAGREAFSLRLLATAAFLILLVRPEVLLGPSFQMSFAAVAAIIALYESPMGRRWLAPREDAPGLLARFGHGLAALLATGLVAEMVLSPIALFHFQQSGLYGVLANLFAIPLASFGIIPALALGLFADALGLGTIAYQPAGWLTSWLIDIARATADMPGAVARLPVMHGLAYAAMVCGALLIILCRGPLRLAGVPFLAMGLVLALGRPPPDLLVSPDGRHVGLRLPSGELALLRPRAGSFLRDSWASALAARDGGRSFDSLSGMACTEDACTGTVSGARGGEFRLLATRSRNWFKEADLAPACRVADIVVSERTLPGWCQPRWLKLDAETLARRGAIALWLDGPRITGALDRTGDYPWYGPPERPL